MGGNTSPVTWGTGCFTLWVVFLAQGQILAGVTSLVFHTDTSHSSGAFPLTGAVMRLENIASFDSIPILHGRLSEHPCSAMRNHAQAVTAPGPDHEPAVRSCAWGYYTVLPCPRGQI